ncbi:MAG: diguanylate cyclase domain-containing protein [Clostridium sp.]
MIMLDGDGLKGINDMYGHHMGDVYLRQIGCQIEFSERNVLSAPEWEAMNFRHFLWLRFKGGGREGSPTLRLIAARFYGSRDETYFGNCRIFRWICVYPADGTDTMC